MFVNIIKRLVAGMLCGCLTVATFCYDAAVQKAVSEDDDAIVINSQEDLEKLYGNDNVYFDNVEFVDDKDLEEEEALHDTEVPSSLPTVYTSNISEERAETKATIPAQAEQATIYIENNYNGDLGAKTDNDYKTYVYASKDNGTNGDNEIDIYGNVTWTIHGTVCIDSKICIRDGGSLTIKHGEPAYCSSKNTSTNSYENLYGGKKVVRIAFGSGALKKNTVSDLNAGESVSLFNIKNGGSLTILGDCGNDENYDYGINGNYSIGEENFYRKLVITGGEKSNTPIISILNVDGSTKKNNLTLIGVDIRNANNDDEKTENDKTVVDGYSGNCGGAIYVEDRTKVGTVKAVYCTFSNCKAVYGGLAYLDGTTDTVLFRNCYIVSCTANNTNMKKGYGGAFYVIGNVTNFTVEGCIISRCVAYSDGSAILFQEQCIVGNATIKGNESQRMIMQYCATYLDTSGGGNNALHGYGGVYASNATINITGSDICYNEAKNGGGVCATYGGDLKMTGGLLRYNKAIGKPAAGIDTSWHEDAALAGVGGGVYLSEGVNANMSTYELTGTDKFGIYGNEAEWAADDVFANGVLTKLTLPSATKMTLEGTEFSRATGWFEDYNDGDTQYEQGLRGDVNVGGRRYKETERTVVAYINADDASGDASASTVYINDANTYVCLTLGTAKQDYGEITITKKGDDIDPTQVFVFRISGTSKKGDHISFYATVTGASTVRISDVPDGTYTVTEIVDWAWRYELEHITIDNDKNQSKSSVSLPDLCGTVIIDSGDTSPDIEFTNRLARDKWLADNSEVEKNVAASTTAQVETSDSFVVYFEQPKKKEPVVSEESDI